jgi:hypothetical protein
MKLQFVRRIFKASTAVRFHPPQRSRMHLCKNTNGSCQKTLLSKKHRLKFIAPSRELAIVRAGHLSSRLSRLLVAARRHAVASYDMTDIATHLSTEQNIPARVPQIEKQSVYIRHAIATTLIVVGGSITICWIASLCWALGQLVKFILS